MNHPEDLNQPLLKDSSKTLHLNVLDKKLKVITKSGRSVSNRLNIVHSSKNLRRNKSVSKSPVRCKSSKSLRSEKDLRKKSNSPPRVTKMKVRRTKTAKNELKDEKFQRIIHKNLLVMNEKQVGVKKCLQDLKNGNCLKKDLNCKIKGNSCRGVKRIGKLQGKGKRNRKDDVSSPRENKDVKGKEKVDFIRKGVGKSLELEKIGGKNRISKLKKIQENRPHKVKRKKGVIKTFDLRNLEDVMTTMEIFKTDDMYEKPAKKPMHLRKSKNSEGETLRPQSVLLKHSKMIPKKKKSKQSDDRLKRIKKRVESKYDVFKEQAAVKLQRWFRRVLCKKKKEKKIVDKRQECPDFDISDILKPCHSSAGNRMGLRRYESDLNSDKLQDSTEPYILPRIGYRNRNYTQSQDLRSTSITQLSTSSLQQKRPKELDIENINTPLVSATYDLCEFIQKSFREENLIENKPESEELKCSFQSDSLESESLVNQKCTEPLIPANFMAEDQVELKKPKKMNSEIKEENILKTKKKDCPPDEKIRSPPGINKLYPAVNLKKPIPNTIIPTEYGHIIRVKQSQEIVKCIRTDDKVLVDSKKVLNSPRNMMIVSPKLIGSEDQSRSEILDLQAQVYLLSIGCTLSDQNSIESEFSSSLIRQLENSLNELDSKNDSYRSDQESLYKIPISSPNLSQNISEILSELLDSEIEVFSSSIPFQVKEKHVDPSEHFLETIIHYLFQEFKKNEIDFLDLINTPGFTDPLEKLQMIQSSNIGDLKTISGLEIMIPQEICEIIQENFDGEQFRGRAIYIQMIFDCVNEALNVLRPFGRKGVPDPWINNSRLLFGEGDLKRVYKKTLDLVGKWSRVRGGVYQMGFVVEDVEKLQGEREERMSAFLCCDVNEEEMFWVDYGDEETQTKWYLHDLVLEELTLEVIRLLN